MATEVIYNMLGIDVETKNVATLIRRLRPLGSTRKVKTAGMYHEDQRYSQVYLDTRWTEEELDKWLYATDGIEWIGTFTRSNGVPL